MDTLALPVPALVALRPLRGAAEVHVRPITVDEYHAMAAAGILTEDDAVELLDGTLVAMSPVSGSHLYAVNQLAEALAERLYALPAPRPVLSIQNPIRLDDRSEPVPDLAILRPEARRPRVPSAADALLVVEVSVSTRAYDRDVKLARYARAGVPEVWLVVPEEGFVEVYRAPGADGYTRMETVRAGGDVACASVAGLAAVPVDELGFEALRKNAPG